MNETQVTQTKEFVFQRLSQPFPFSSPETPYWLAWLVAGGLLLFAALSFVIPMIRVIRGVPAGLALRGIVWAALAYVGVVAWLGLSVVSESESTRSQLFFGMVGGQVVLALLFGISGLLTVLSGGNLTKGGNTEGIAFGTLLTVLFGRADTGPLTWWHLAAAGGRSLLFLIPLAFLGIARGFETDTEPVWYGFTGAMLYTACGLTCLMYMKDSGVVSWWGLPFVLLPLPFVGPPVLMLLAGLLLLAVGHFRSADFGAWAKVAPMALLRTLTLSVLAFCFLLPAFQPWETTEKRSKVVILLDISPSLTVWSDEVSRDPSAKLKTRMDKVLDFLTADDGAFLAELLKKNPVAVYRFGSVLDTEAGVMPQNEDTPKAGAWSRDEWAKFVEYDFKPWVLNYTGPDGTRFSDDAKAKLQNAPAWDAGKPGDREWATGWVAAADSATGADALSDGTNDTPDDKKLFAAVKEKLPTRVDVARAISQGTAVPESVTAAVNREQANMTQAMIVFTDGRSNMSSDSALPDLTRRAKEANIPVYTVAVGSSREVVSLVISDLQAPDRTQPDEPTQVTVAVDGIGFKQGDQVDAVLELFLPGKDPKSDPADHELTKTVTFGGGETPHGEATFVLDAEELAAKGAASLVEEISPPKPGRKWQLKKGTWQVRAKVATDPREIFREPFHLSPVRKMEVIDKPLRVLLVSSAPTREYQTLRTLLVREVEQKRAELSIYLQNDGGTKGTIVQDVPPGRLLLKFPDELDVSKETTPGGGGDPGSDAEVERQRAKYNNLNEYDLIICFDPNWNERDDSGQYRIPEGAFTKLKTWVQTLGGGFVYVAGPFFTAQLVRVDEEGGRLRPILDILPVEPDDIIASDDVLLKVNDKKTPRRLKFNPPTDSDLLKLDDDSPLREPELVAVAGWERFFTGNDTPPKKTETEYLQPRRGFYSYYPVKQVKPGLKPLAEFVNVDEKGQEALRPYYAVSQSGAGRAAWLGSGEIYRLRAVPEDGVAYYDKFWLQLARYASAKRNSGAKARGQVLISKEIIAGSPIRVQARVLQASGDPYPEQELDQPKLTIEQLDQNGNVTDRFGPFDVLKPTKLGQKFEGYYKGVVTPDPAKMKVEGFRYRVSVTKSDLPDALSAEFLLRAANPELDNTKPDTQTLYDAASPVSVVLDAEPDAGKRAELTARLGTTDDEVKQGKAKLAFSLDDTQKLGVIPELIKSRSESPQNRGIVDPLWDDEYDPAQDPATDWARIVLFSTPVSPSWTFAIRVWVPVTFVLLLVLALTWILRTRADLPDTGLLERLVGCLIGVLFVPFGIGVVLAIMVLASPRYRSAAAGVMFTLAMLMQALFVGLTVWYGNPFPVGYAVIALAALLCSEWTLRKLFRLA